jgi:hypothetical protein
VFDASDNSWTIHLQGARSLVQGACVTRATPLQAFLLDRLTYHDVLEEHAHLRSIGNEQSSGSMVIEIMSTELADGLRTQLQNLRQVVQVATGAKTGNIDVERITLTADFYRKAAHLYPEQVVPIQRAHDLYVESLIEDCLRITDRLGLCTFP